MNYSTMNEFYDIRTSISAQHKTRNKTIKWDKGFIKLTNVS